MHMRNVFMKSKVANKSGVPSKRSCSIRYSKASSKVLCSLMYISAIALSQRLHEKPLYGMIFLRYKLSSVRTIRIHRAHPEPLSDNSALVFRVATSSVVIKRYSLDSS